MYILCMCHVVILSRSLVVRLVVSILLYGCESWTLTSDLEKNPGIRAHVLLKIRAHLIHRAEHRTNDSVRQVTNYAGRQERPFHGQATETGLTWPHLPQDSLAKIILQGTVEDKHRTGRPMKSWLENIKDSTKQSSARLLLMVEDRQSWCITVAKASTVSPKRVSMMLTG